MRATVYLHSSKETMHDIGARAGLQGDALAMFLHALTEVEVEIDVDEITGEATIVGVDGRALAP